MFDFNATFIVAMLSFVLFIMIMNAIFYAPILNIIRKRDEYVEANYSDSKEFDAKAGEYKQNHSQKIKETQDICRQDFKQKISEIQAQATEKVHAAREESKISLKDRKEELSQKEQILKDNINDGVLKDLATAVTDKIINGVTE